MAKAPENFDPTKEITIPAAGVMGEIQQAVKVADKMVSDWIDAMLDKHNEVKAGAVALLINMQNVYGDTPLTTIFPRPVAKAEDEAGVNGPHEHFKAVKPNKAGELKETNCNFFTEYFNETTAGKALLHTAQQLALMDGPNEANAEERFRDMPKDKRDNLAAKIKTDRQQGRKWVRDMAACAYALSDLEGYEERAVLEFVLDDDQTLQSNSFPFTLVDATKARMFKPLSVTDVLRLDIPRAILEAGESGSLYQRIVDQLKRQGNTPEGQVGNFASINDMLKEVPRFVNYFDTESPEGRAHMDAFLKMLRGKGSDEAVLFWGRFRVNAMAVWDDGLEVRYQRLEEKHSKANAAPAPKADAA